MGVKLRNGVEFKNLHFVLDIPEELTVDQTRLREDVSLWSNNELKGDYSVIFTYMPENEPIRLYFEHENDMLHFKLRWVGSAT